MQCITPITIAHEAYGSYYRMVVPCGKCMACLVRKRQEWVFRCKQELRRSPVAFFVTLTYDEDNVTTDEDGNAILSKVDVQKFLKRLRKANPECNIRYFLAGEYGPTTLRPHYHAIIYNLPSDDSPFKIRTQKLIEKSWQKGNVYVGEDCGGAAINYAAKYLLTPSILPEAKNLPPPFLLSSRRPAIGSNYVTEATKQYHETRNNTVACDGVPLPLPRYYKTKVQSEKVRKANFEEWYENEQEENLKKRIRLDILRKYYPKAFKIEMQKLRNFQQGKKLWNENRKKLLTKNSKL